MNIRAMQVTSNFIRVEMSDGRVMTVSRHLLRIRALAAGGNAEQRESSAAGEAADSMEQFFGSHLIGRGCVSLRFDVDTGRPTEFTVTCPDGGA